MLHDLLIKGGLVVDGTGSPGVYVDVAVNAGLIVAMGQHLDVQAKQVIDAQGLVVCPGFIDIKTHSDFTLPINPKAESKLRQGVTTEIIGHCGFSVAPCLPDRVKLLADYLNPSAPWLPFRAMDFGEYLQTFPATSVNVGMLVGHNTLRLMSMGMAQRAPNAQEMNHMQEMLLEGLDAGALGMSTGLFTSPGSYAQTEELVALAKTLETHHAAYFTHLRDESNGVMDALEEAIAIGQEAKIHVQVVHFKCSGLDNWGKTSQALERMQQARDEGVDIDCDAYPYTAGSNPLKNILPQWVQAGGVQAMLERLGQDDVREKIKHDIERDGLNNWGKIESWDAVRISISPNLPHCAGQTIAQLAKESSTTDIDALCDFLIKDQGATRVLITSISEDDVKNLIRSDQTMVGSDGNCVADYGVVSQGLPHPRFYGTFPRVLGRYVKREQVTTLEHAIHKMTGATARALRLKSRGLLRVGLCADITVFEPDVFLDLSTYEKPHQYPAGHNTSVIVNGVVVIDKSHHTGATPGVVLKRRQNELGLVA
jgi:N-acyl-D-amino-acid deacylase